MEYILAHDVGTSGCKSVLFNLGAAAGEQVVATAYETYPTYYPQPMYAEQDVEDWWKGVVKGTRHVLEKSGAKPEQVLALSFSFQMLNTIPVDKDGVPLRNCISWLDGRAWEEAEQVMRKLGGASIFSTLVGAVLSGKDLLPKYSVAQAPRARGLPKSGGVHGLQQLHPSPHHRAPGLRVERCQCHRSVQPEEQDLG